MTEADLFNTWIQIIDDEDDNNGANTPGNIVVAKDPPRESQLVHEH